jgi:tetratricopeptide (TPR) repeat protein
VPYLQSAAEQALGRSAQLEAIQHLGALLEAVERLPQGPDRDRAELRARMTLGPALIAVEGFASPEVEGAFLRARELCGRLGDPPELPLVLHGLAAVNEFRGRYHVSEEILEQLLGAGDSPLAVEAHELLACSTFHQGKAATAVGYAEAGLALYDEDRDSGYLAPYGEHPAVACHDWAALALWFLGHPDRALAHAERALGLAREHPYSLATAKVQLTMIFRAQAPPFRAGLARSAWGALLADVLLERFPAGRHPPRRRSTTGTTGARGGCGPSSGRAGGRRRRP